MPNLIIVKRVGSWPIGAIVPKAALPNGFQGHLDLGVVAETQRPATHALAMADLPTANRTTEESAATTATLRSRIADLESQVAGFQEALVNRDERIRTLESDLAAAEEMLKTAGDIAVAQNEAKVQAGLVGGPSAKAAMSVVPPPWGG